MTREDVLKQFPDATDEQISAILNMNHAELNKEKDKISKLKDSASKVEELQAELDRLNEDKLSDIEKANKATETANNKVAELEKQIKAMQTKANLAEKGITGEQAEKLIKEDGSLDFDILGQIISDREQAAATAKEQEIANAAGNPGGDEGGTHDDELSSAEQIAKKLAESNAQSGNDDILSHYINN